MALNANTSFVLVVTYNANTHFCVGCITYKSNTSFVLVIAYNANTGFVLAISS